MNKCLLGCGYLFPSPLSCLCVLHFPSPTSQVHTEPASTIHLGFIAVGGRLTEYKEYANTRAHLFPVAAVTLPTDLMALNNTHYYLSSAGGWKSKWVLRAAFLLEARGEHGGEFISYIPESAFSGF